MSLSVNFNEHLMDTGSPSAGETGKTGGLMSAFLANPFSPLLDLHIEISRWNI